MIILTKPQRKALHLVYLRGDHSKLPYQSYKTFRKKVRPGPGCIMIRWCNMWLGIEPDGYTHS